MQVIHVVNRAALIGDAWAFNKAGILDIKTALHTLDYLNSETEYIPWGAVVKELAYLDRMLVSTPVCGNFERFMIDKVKKTFREHQLNISIDQSVQKIYLDYSIGRGDTTIRSQDARFAILAVASNPLGLQMTWRFVRSNWKYIVEDSRLDSYAQNQIVFGISRLLYTDYNLSEVKQWETGHLELADSLPGFEQGIETIKNNKAWVDHDYPVMENWHKANYHN
ncbi:Hypothetical predicted protein [Mytilus galloprovincialis]|uniref:ERAP1-like C-terminal domain-containing protein n=1 Tax=Mytilus galloprovincialis TaxID=29158 RepID=A0A8B6F8T6_MYTGA|nr:Hypothetical predicted protein [Mytilus galloprovincialis]